MTAAGRRASAFSLAFCILLAALLLLFAVATRGRAAELTRLEAGAAFAPPHNEPVVGEHVARYKFETDAGIRIWKIDVDGNAKVWFLNSWQPSSIVGHGFPEAWENSRWGVESIRVDWTLRAGVDVWRGWQIYGEHNRWEYVAGDLPKQHASTYSWLFGIRYKYR